MTEPIQPEAQPAGQNAYAQVPPAPSVPPQGAAPTPQYGQQAYPEQSAYSPYPPVAAPRKSHKQLWLGIGVGFVAGILLSVTVAVAGAVGSSVTASSAISDAVKGCNAQSSSGISVGDNGQSVSIDTKGQKDSSGASITDTACILKKLNVPDSVVSEMDATNALQGRQSATWDNIDATWSYHPDSGLNLILNIKK